MIGPTPAETILDKSTGMKRINHEGTKTRSGSPQISFTSLDHADGFLD
jgi:hypothetical protein